MWLIIACFCQWRWNRTLSALNRWERWTAVARRKVRRIVKG